MITLKRFFNEFKQSSPSVRIIIIILVMIWGLVLASFIGVSFLYMERLGQASEITPSGEIPTIVLEPTAGVPGTPTEGSKIIAGILPLGVISEA